MKKRSLEPPKLPWSKNKINSNPHLSNPQNSDLPGSRSLMSLDSSVPPEMTASSLSDSPKVLKASSKIAPLKGKEEALTQMVTKWRSKVSVKQQQQPNKPSKPPATTLGNTKVITVTTTSSKSTLNSSNSTPAKSSVVFLSNCNKTSSRVFSKIKDSPTTKTVSKNEICQVDSSSGIPVTSGPIGSKTKTAVTVKRKSIGSTNQAALSSNRNPQTPQTKTNENNSLSTKSSSATLPQVKSSSLSSLVRLNTNNSNNLIPSTNSSQGKTKPKSSEITADKSPSPLKSSSPGLKSNTQSKGLDDQSKRFYERRPKSGTVARNMLKPLILYLNEPDVSANECSSKADSTINESHSINVQDLHKDDQESVTSQTHQSMEKDETIVSKSDADNIFQACLNSSDPTSKEASDSPSAEIEKPVISEEEPSVSSQQYRETAILDSSFESPTFEQPLKWQSPSELKIIVDSCCTQTDVDGLTSQETKQKHQETNEASCRPSFPLCSSPSPSFTSSDNSYSDNDWDDCENYKRDAPDAGSKIFEFWFDQESPEQSMIAGVNGKSLCTSPEKEIKSKKSDAETTFDDQTKLVEFLKKCQLQTGISDDVDEESEPGVIRAPDDDHNNQTKQKLYHTQQNFTDIGSPIQGVISTKAFSNQYFHPRACHLKSNLESKRPPSSERFEFLNRSEYLETSDLRLNASDDMRNLLEWLKVENNELETRCNQLSRENSSLTELLKLSRRDLEISDLKNQQNKTETETELERLRSEKGRLLNQLQLPDNDHCLLVAMEGEIAHYKHRIDQLELQRSEAAQEVKDLKKDLEEAKLEAEEIRDRFSQEDNRDLRRLRDDLDCCVRECRLLHFKNRQSDKKCDLYKARISDLEASLNVCINKSSKRSLNEHEVESQINSGHLEQSKIDLSENLFVKQQNHSNMECVDRLKEELKEAREVSIRLHEECERLTKDCLKHKEALSSFRRGEDDLISLQCLSPKEEKNKPGEALTTSHPNNANFEETISNFEDSKSEKRLEELEVENKRLMEVLVYMRRKLEHTNGDSATFDTFKMESANLMDHSIQTKCFQHPDLKVNIHPSIQEFQADDSQEPSEGENVKMSVPVSPPQMRPLLSPAIENSEVNRSQDLLPTHRDKVVHQKENELMSSVMARHRQEMNSLLQTLRRKERQFSEERKILRRKNLELSEMFDLLAERATTPGRTCSPVNRDSQTESSWFEVEERLNRLENEIKERITAEQISRRQLAEMERELHEKITDYEEKLNVMVENVARKNKAIERKEQIIVRLTCSATELEKTLIEKCREFEEKEQKYNGMSMNLLEMEEERIKCGEEKQLLKKKLNELEKQLNLALDARESLQKELKTAKGLNESQVLGNLAREESHLKETQNLNSEDMKAKVNDAFPEVVMRSRTKTPHPHSSRRSRSLSEMEHVITACMNDINCTYSLVPLKFITKIPSPSEPKRHLTTSTKCKPTIDIKTYIGKVNDPGVLLYRTSERSDNRFMNAEKIYLNFSGGRPDTLSLKSPDFAYPVTPPSMILTPTSTLPDSNESLPLKEFVTNSSDSTTFCHMNSEQPCHDAQDLMSSSLYDKPMDSLTPVHEHSFTLPRSVKFAEPKFTEENALERLARAFDRNPTNRCEFKRREVGKHRSSSLSPRTARKRFLFTTLESDNNTHNTSKFMGNHFLEQHNPHQSLKISPYSSSISSTCGDGNVSDNSSRDMLPHVKKGYSGSKEISCSDKVSSTKGVESSRFSFSESAPRSSNLNQSPADSSSRSGMSSKLLSLLVDPFKKLKKSGSNKTSQASSPQILSNNLKMCEISDRSMTPPARFFRETKPKKRPARKPDSGSLPSLIQLSCLPSI